MCVCESECVGTMAEYNDDGDDSPVVDDAEEELLEGAEDDLDDNPFYRVFATHFRTEYNVLQEYGGILCVPHSALLYNVRITQSLVGLFLTPHFGASLSLSV